ncbi:conserved unknown protein [Ectocarpus siliculosus]|uniref:THIF-type NAD/FAD binding fold domain-containing protein n=1 Tax=Ectocarpus siliculosus TaxID=2880 RepID=D7G035_ECTSI|nr:conserved unknown protein [Ectocarpus siliculosus]|eukprot:CBJ32917.1 conserved unknown protein [Ectocarpus siliculosus]
MATDNKYDRQLRLWGGSGQKALMEANILLVNAGATGTETLKNLVLPGVGQFTILDAEEVRQLDQGSNFFVGPEHVGLPRAKVTAELLCEMNPDVKGGYVQEDPDSQMNKADTLLTHPIGTPNSMIPSFHHLKALRGHCVVESKPEGNKPDLRISQPWPELLEYCQSIDFDTQEGALAAWERDAKPQLVVTAA